MGNNVRQCAECGWTCYGSRSEMKKHRRTAHPKPKPTASYRPAPMNELVGPGGRPLDDEVTDALAEMEHDDHDEMFEALDHLHADIMLIHARLGIGRPECSPPQESTEERPQ